MASNRETLHNGHQGPSSYSCPSTSGEELPGHRPTRWGNPISVEEYDREESMKRYAQWLEERLVDEPDFLEPLRGYNLGCFCGPDVACHADIILRRLYGFSSTNL